MNYFPVFVDLRGRPCLVVGGGEVAFRKARQLLEAGACVTVNAPQVDARLEASAAQGSLTIVRTAFDPALVQRHFLIVAATDDRAVNAHVHQVAQAAMRLVNSVDDPAHCNYLTPAIVDRSPIVIAISTGGTAPVLGRLLREQLERMLPSTLGRLAALAGAFRDEVKRRLPGIARRRRFWEAVFGGPAAGLVHAGREAQARERIGLELEATASEANDRPGEVFLVGAGPGDPGLLTLRALQVMQQADVVLHDRLVSPEVLALVRRDATLVRVGKSPGGRCVSQSQINALLVEHAQAGRRVCRLKGGDPFVFGRGGEELVALREAGIMFEVVPGITAALGCAAYAGIPLTHRDHAHGVRFLTAHGQGADDELDWAGIAHGSDTLVFYMGTARAGHVRERLLSNGRDAATPVAIVGNGTLASQRVVTGTLGGLDELVSGCGIRAPALIVVGTVAAFAHELHWFGDAPEAPLEHTALVAARAAA